MSNNCSIRVFFVNGPFFTRATDKVQKSLNQSGKCLVKKDFFFFFLIESLIGSQTLLPGVPRSTDKAINGSFFEHFRAWSYNKCGADTSCVVLTWISCEYPLFWEPKTVRHAEQELYYQIWGWVAQKGASKNGPKHGGIWINVPEPLPLRKENKFTS